MKFYRNTLSTLFALLFNFYLIQKFLKNTSFKLLLKSLCKIMITLQTMIRYTTHHTSALDANIVLFRFAWSAVDHGDFVPVEKSLASWHAIQFALIGTSGVWNPTMKKKKYCVIQKSVTIDAQLFVTGYHQLGIFFYLLSFDFI